MQPVQEIAELRSRVAELERRIDLLDPRPRPVAAAAAPARPFAPAPARDYSGIQIAPRPGRDWTETLLDPRLLGWAGAVVALLGVVFFLVYAARNGWITPAMRVDGGFAAAATAFAGGWLWRRRSPDMVAARVVCGLGAAGMDVAVLAGSRVYHLIGSGSATLVAAGIAAAVVAAAWTAEDSLLATYGISSLLVMPAVAAGGLPLWTAPIVLVTAAAAVALSAARRWRAPAIATIVLAAPQLAVAAGVDPAIDHTLRIALAAAAVLLLAIGGAALTARRLGRTGEAMTSVTLLVALVAADRLAPAHLLGLHGAGIALVALAAGYALLALGARRLLPAAPETAVVSAMLAVAMVGVAAAALIASPNVGYEWAAEAAALAIAGRRLDLRRYRIAGAIFAALSVVPALVATPPSRLAVATAHPAAGIGLVLAATLALAAVAWSAREGGAARATVAAAVAAGIYAAALCLLGAAAITLGHAPSQAEVNRAFAHGQVAISAAGALAGLALAWFGLRRASTRLRGIAVGVLAVAAAKLFLLDLSALDPALRALSFGAVGAALIAAGWLSGRLGMRTART